MTRLKAGLSAGARPALLRASVSAASRLPAKAKNAWLRIAVSARTSRPRAIAASTGSGRVPRRQATATAITQAISSAKKPMLTRYSGLGRCHSVT